MNHSIDRAWALTHGDRHNQYGDATQVFAAYAKMWSALLSKKLNADITAEDVTLMMAGLKLCREAHSPKDDNVIDAHGYLILMDEIKCARFGRDYVVSHLDATCLCTHGSTKGCALHGEPDIDPHDIVPDCTCTAIAGSEKTCVVHGCLCTVEPTAICPIHPGEAR